jgi:demethylmenaquinone methyltransferase/2-methoxy-6-polyprenyl-1,4-benzoquinol methylase
MVRRTWLVAALGLVGAGAAISVACDEGDDDVTDASWIADRYDRLAALYDVLAAPYDWIDGRRLVRRAVAELGLAPGDTAVALGTGTGWSLPLLAEAVGPNGRVVGVDLSEGMLRRARARVEQAGVGDRVDLMVADMRTADLPADTSGVLAAFSAEMVTDHQQLVDHLRRQLPAGARIAFAGLREPEAWPDWLVRLGIAANRIFGTRPLHRDMAPWQPLLDHLDDTTYEQDFGGAVYLAVGTVPGAEPG